MGTWNKDIKSSQVPVSNVTFVSENVLAYFYLISQAELVYTTLQSLLVFPFSGLCMSLRKQKGARKPNQSFPTLLPWLFPRRSWNSKLSVKQETGKPFMNLKGHKIAQSVLWQFFLAHWQCCFLRVLIPGECIP